MEEYILIRPENSYAEEVKAFRREFIEAGSSMDGCGELRKSENFEEYMRSCEAHTRRETLPEGRSLSQQLWYVRKSDGALVG